MSIVSTKYFSLVALAAMATFAGCADEEATSNPVELKSRSVTPVLVKVQMPGVEAFPLLSSDDTLANSPNYIFGGSADGIGLLKEGDEYVIVVNNEDNYSVSQITLDKTFAPMQGKYLLNSDGGKYRLCSATLATPEEHGFPKATFLTAGESNEKSQSHALDPITGADQILTDLGQAVSENVLPLPKTAYPGKTVILTTDDDSGPGGGQVALYYNTSGVGAFTGGKLHYLCRKDGKQTERDMQANQPIPVEFKEVDNTLTGDLMNSQEVGRVGAIKFGRVEDIDYAKDGTGRTVYFVVTGQAYSGANADSSRAHQGRMYRLTLDDAADPRKGGTLTCLLDGDDNSGPASMFQDPDGICVTENYAYIGEDPNGYGSGTEETHDAYLYQYDLHTEALKVVMELDNHSYVGNTKYDADGKAKNYGAWEYGGVIDISSVIGIDNVFLVCVQPHTWLGDRYKGVDGGTGRPAENQASQILVVKGMPR